MSKISKVDGQWVIVPDLPAKQPLDRASLLIGGVLVAIAAVVVTFAHLTGYGRGADALSVIMALLGIAWIVAENVIPQMIANRRALKDEGTPVPRKASKTLNAIEAMGLIENPLVDELKSLMLEEFRVNAIAEEQMKLLNMAESKGMSIDDDEDLSALLESMRELFAKVNEHRASQRALVRLLKEREKAELSIKAAELRYK